MGRHHHSNMDLLTRRGQETLDVVRKFISSFTTEGTRSAEENISILGTTLASIFLLLLLLEIFNYHGGKWTSRLCKLNIIIIGASLVSVKHKFIPGIVPAVLIAGLDVIVCSLYSLSYFYSLLLNSLKGILALCVAALAMIYGEALLNILIKNNVL